MADFKDTQQYPTYKRSVIDEVAKNGYRLHRRMVLLAVLILPLFPDYIFMPEAWQVVLTFRGVLVIYFIVLLYAQKSLNFNHIWLAYLGLIPLIIFLSFITASVEAKYHLVYHVNYSAVFIVTSLFLLWHWKHSMIICAFTVAIHLLFIALYQTLSIMALVSNGSLLLFTIAFAGIALVGHRYKSFCKEFVLKYELELSNAALQSKNKELHIQREQIILQKENIEEKNHKITASINYAKRIQKAILGSTEQIEQAFDGNAFVFFQPKDIVSGDFYWLADMGNKQLLVVADCTGHGVPGAFMTVLGHSLLNEIAQSKYTDAAEVLYELDRRITAVLQKDKNNQANDGMDMVVLIKEGRQLQFAGAKNPLVLVRDGKAEQIKGAKFPIGSGQYKVEKTFETHYFEALPNDCLYLFSDGFQDQFGGVQGRKYMTKRFREFLQNISTQPIGKQKTLIVTEFEVWKGNHPQTDDVLVVGIQVKE